MQSTTRVQTLQRWWEVQGIFLRYGFGFLVARGNRRRARATADGPLPQIEQLAAPQRLRLMLEELGPTFVKLGQVVSSQTHTIPREWLQELEKLQDDVPPFAEAHVRATIASELGEQPEQLFREFAFAPLAAASIGQVHTAVTMDNQAVVVKVQRPDIAARIAADIAIMREIARTLEKTTAWAQSYGVTSVVDQFATSITSELDYRNEANNADIVRENLSEFSHVRTPTIYWPLTSRRVLTMERVSGVKVTELGAASLARDRLDELAKAFVQAMVKQVLIDGFFHADVHPGNVFVDAQGGEIVLIDLGMTGTLDTRQRAQLSSLMRALSQLNARHTTRVVLALGETFKPVDEPALEKAIDHLMQRHLGGSLAQLSYSGFLGDMLSVFFEHGVRIPSDLLFALKALMQTEQIVRTLKPEFEITDLAGEISAQLMRQQLKPAQMQTHLTGAIDRAIHLAPLASEALEQYLYETSSGRRTTRLDPTDLRYLSHGASQLVNRVILVLVLLGMLFASVLVLAIGQLADQLAISVIGLIGTLFSLAAGALVVMRLIWDRWRP